MSNSFKKEKEYILCVDSDGCAMDTMNYKHIKCFGPLAADVWNITQRESFLQIWNEINLFSKTRGINRFKALVLALRAIQKKDADCASPKDIIGDFSYLAEWVYSAPVLSNQALEHAIDEKRDSISDREMKQLEQALTWSKRVNEHIQALHDEARPFNGVFDALQKLHEKVHIAVVSSANSDAIYSEWGKFDLLRFTDLIFGQESGSKAACIKTILSYAFDPKKVLMVGDSPGDLQAAESNSVFFYPILFGKEQESWDVLCRTAVPKLLEGCYGGIYQDGLKKQFTEHLGI
ncbi:HAD family hydrolase [Treponema phagedenis]|uniref:HAD family hydrolase n=1 Tax=Treponema phagedenis TaxID=162 RepID=UPI0001F63AA7|nr:HAD hydrolase-like protein [Treponema phagedenis]EFW38884.1 hydrolase, haloacid dehalogenase-like family protein [Treponema phagedenis F0421]TYT78753.1 HAD family hydrolase [Treponema phagedenis]